MIIGEGCMKITGFEKIKDGKYLKNYELSYINKLGKIKKYEIVSRNDINSPDELGNKVSGLSIIAFKDDKMLLLKEYRLSVNRYIYNLCAGMLEPGETIEECVRRELYEETGLDLVKIHHILPPSFSAVAICDVKTYTVFAEVSGEFSDHTSENELIIPNFYSKDEINKLLETEEFSSRSQIAAYMFANKDI